MKAILVAVLVLALFLVVTRWVTFWFDRCQSQGNEWLFFVMGIGAPVALFAGVVYALGWR